MRFQPDILFLPVEPLDFILDKFLGEETELFQISADLEHLFILFFINIGLVAIFTSNSVIFNSIRVHCGGVWGKVKKKSVYNEKKRGKEKQILCRGINRQAKNSACHSIFIGSSRENAAFETRRSLTNLTP